MSFRRRLLLLFALTVLVSVAAVTGIVSVMTRRAFDRANDERTAVLVAQFRREFTRRRDEVRRRVQAAAASSAAERMAVAAAQNSPDYSSFLDDAQVLAEAQRLDFLEFADDRGTIISSAQWPAKFGYREPLAQQSPPADAFLKQEETPSGVVFGLFAVNTVAAGDHKIYAIGGTRLDRTFLSSLDLPSGMRVMLYENVSGPFSSDRLIVTGDPVQNPQALAPLVEKVHITDHDASSIVRWDSGEDETVNAFPLLGEKNQTLAVLLVGSSRKIYGELRTEIRSAALLASAAGLLLAVVLSSIAAVRVTRPVEELARAAREVASGNLDTQVAAHTQDELGVLADAFNRMTHDLIDNRERLVQAERVAAWRELARRLAHELKNPLFPLQLTVENLLRSRDQSPKEFEETFRESASTLLLEIANLKSIIHRFSEFSKMPQPQLREVSLPELIQGAIQVYEAQFQKMNINCRKEFSGTEKIYADPELLHRAVSNLVLNAIDAMPKGGTLTLRTSATNTSALIEVSDEGTGLTREECDRLFTPYYTSKAHGTGLGLAIVQSIVSDHGGRISVKSQPGEGSTFIIELPVRRELLSAGGTHA
ncbi:MAG TPA: ATP-binding protein [Terriglobales bacterium]|jgi:signal transduction histidine kinase|nr:ATP-binding protein [Terriglobales bacterium]